MNAAELTVADSMYRALRNFPCACEHNVPYAGGQVEQHVTRMCARCRSMRQWEAMNRLAEVTAS